MITLVLVGVIFILWIITSIGLYLSLMKNFEMSDRLESVEEAIEESLDMLNDVYGRIEAKSKMEVFSDEPVVKELVRDIVESKKMIHKVALLIDSSLVTEEVETEETEK